MCRTGWGNRMLGSPRHRSRSKHDRLSGNGLRAPGILDLMSNPEESGSSEILRRTSDYTPPRSLGHWLIGKPLQTADVPHQSIGKAIGLAVFASDALS